MDIKVLFENNNIDAYIITGAENRRYFTDFSSSFGAVILTKEGKYFMTDPRYETAAREKLKDWDIRIIKKDELYETARQIFKKCDAKNIGFEDNYIRHDSYLRFFEEFKEFNLIAAGGNIMGMRAIKSEEEIKNIAAAQKIAKAALNAALDIIKPKVTERDITAELVYQIYKNGGEEYSFHPIVAFGENTAKPHHNFSERKLSTDDLILIDMGVKFNGYCSDMTRTFCLGDPGDTLKKVYNIVLEAQEYTLKNIKAGQTGREADSFAREYIKSRGYGDYFGHGSGHGVGLYIHELPSLSPDSDDVLKENMVITVEPGIYLPGEGGVRIEDMAVVTKDGIVNLTNFDKKLKI